MTVAARRAAVRAAQDAGLSERRACALAQLNRATARYRIRRAPQESLRTRLRELAAVRLRWGYRRLHLLLRREGYQVNHKRGYRPHRDEGLAVRRRHRKRVAQRRGAMVAPDRPDAQQGADLFPHALDPV